MPKHPGLFFLMFDDAIGLFFLTFDDAIGLFFLTFDDAIGVVWSVSLFVRCQVYGALRWLEMPDLTAEDVVDLMDAADQNRDGLLDYHEYMDWLRGDAKDEDEDDGNRGDKADGLDAQRVPLPKVEPFGADALREVI